MRPHAARLNRQCRQATLTCWRGRKPDMGLLFFWKGCLCRSASGVTYISMDNIPTLDPDRPPVDEENPLLSKKTVGAIGLLVFPGIGIALMSIDVLFSGAILCVIGCAGIIWLYWSDFVPLSLRKEKDNLSSGERAIALIILAIAIVVPIVVGIHIFRSEQEKPAAEQNIEMAKRWIRLSDDILADVPSVKNTFRMPTYDSNMTQAIREQMWQEETQRSLDAFQQGLAILAQKYSGRVAEAKLEMKRLNITLI